MSDTLRDSRNFPEVMSRGPGDGTVWISGTGRAVPNENAFAALTEAGGVIAWGSSFHGGDISSVADQLQSGVIDIIPTSTGFAALKDDGSVTAWGEWATPDPETAELLRSGVERVVSSDTSFAALKDDGSVVVWGRTTGSGGVVFADESAYDAFSSGIVDIFSWGRGFFGIREDGAVIFPSGISGDDGGSFVALEDISSITVAGQVAAVTDVGSVVLFAGEIEEPAVRYPGGYLVSRADELQNDVARVFANAGSFAALRNDGSVVTWGTVHTGGEGIPWELTEGVTEIFTTNGAFAALRQDGSLTTWGNPVWPSGGADSTAVQDQIDSGVEHVFSSTAAFAALKSDGSIVSWGGRVENFADVQHLLQQDVEAVSSTHLAFAALRSDGSVVTWGDPVEGWGDDANGGDSSAVAAEIDAVGSPPVVAVYATSRAFAALREDGSVVNWGGFALGSQPEIIEPDPALLGSGVVGLASPFGTPFETGLGGQPNPGYDTGDGPTEPGLPIDLAESTWSLLATTDDAVLATLDVTFTNQFGASNPAVMGFVDWASAGQPGLGREEFDLFINQDDNSFRVATYHLDPPAGYAEQEFTGSLIYGGDLITGAVEDDTLGRITFNLTRDGEAAPAPSVWSIDSMVGDDEAVFTISRDPAEQQATVHVSTVQDRGAANDGIYAGIENLELRFAPGEPERQVTVDFLEDRATDSDLDFSLIVQADPSDPIDTYLARTGFTVPASDEAPAEPNDPPQDDPPQDDLPPDAPPADDPPGEDGGDDALPNVVEAGNFILQAADGWQDTTSGTVNSNGGAVTIGVRNGISDMLRVDGARVTATNNEIRVSDGVVFSQLTDLGAPLFRGNFSFNPNSFEVASIEHFDAPDTFRFAGLVRPEFSDIAFDAGGVSFGTGFALDGTSFATDPGFARLSLEPGVLSFDLNSDNVSIGQFYSAPFEFTLPGTNAEVELTFENLTAAYDFPEDAFYFGGRAELGWGGLIAGSNLSTFGVDRSVTLDLAGEDNTDTPDGIGDKFVRVASSADGPRWDIVGDVSYTAEAQGPQPPVLQRLQLGLDTLREEVSGEADVTVPFLKNNVLSASLTAVYNPIALDSFRVGFDELDAPLAIGATGLFVRGGHVRASDLAAEEGTVPSYGGRIEVSYGTPVNSIIVGSLDGTFSSDRIEVELELGTTGAQLIGPGFASTLETFLGIRDLDELEVFTFKGDLDVNIATDRPIIRTEVEASFLNDLIEAEGSLQINRPSLYGDPIRGFEIELSGQLNIPDALPAVGGHSVEGNARVEYWENQDPQENHISAWASFENPFSFLAGPDEFSYGFLVGFDGSFGLLNSDEITVTSSWDLTGTEEFVWLSAQWENAAQNVELTIDLPDGRTISEDELDQFDNIALLDDLNNETSRHILIADPEEGRWDIQVADPDPLGEITYTGSNLREDPQLALEVAGFDASTRTVSLAYGVENAEEGSTLTVYLSEDGDISNGIRAARTTIADVDESGNLDLDLAGFAPGEYFIHATLAGASTAPVNTVADTPVELAGAADLRIEIEEAAITDPGIAQLAIHIENAGDIRSGAGAVTLNLPEGLTADLDMSGDFEPVEEALQFAFENLYPGESIAIELAVQIEEGFENSPLQAEVSSTTFDANPSLNEATYFLGSEEIRQSLVGEDADVPVVGLVLDRSGDGLEDAVVTFTPEDDTDSSSTVTDATGAFSLDLVQNASGTLSVEREVKVDDPSISASDALDVLRLAVGLEPSWGPAEAHDYIAADINRDGQVTAQDALEVLRHAVGLESEHAPEWVFLDAQADLEEIDRDNVDYDTGVDFAAIGAAQELSMTGILTGSMQEYA